MIVVALVALAGASLAYLHPTFATTPKVALPSASPPVLSSPAFDVAYDFVTPSVGWALELSRQTGPSVSPGEFWVFRTVDGARHWQKQVSGQSHFSGATRLLVQFFDKTHGLIQVGDPLEVFRTADGGVHWDPVGLPSSQVDTINFSDAQHGWLLAWLTPDPRAANLFATGDGGDTWQQLADPPLVFAAAKAIASFGGITFRRPTEGWMGGGGMETPTVFSSTDGGRTWQSHVMPILAQVCHDRIRQPRPTGSRRAREPVPAELSRWWPVLEGDFDALELRRYRICRCAELAVDWFRCRVDELGRRQHLDSGPRPWRPRTSARVASISRREPRPVRSDGGHKAPGGDHRRRGRPLDDESLASDHDLT